MTGPSSARAARSPRGRSAKDEAEPVYLCGLSIWSCMTAPLALGGEVQAQELTESEERRRRTLAVRTLAV
jgi:hypothetical protein